MKQCLKNFLNLFFLIYFLTNQCFCTIVYEEDKYDYLPILNFTVPRHDPTNACIKLQSSFFITVNYAARVKDEEITKQTNITILETDNFTYTGFCQPERNQIQFLFLDDWRLEFYFYKTKNDTFKFDHVVLYYKLDGPLFPDSIHHGAQSEVYDSPFIESLLSKSYRCYSGIHIDLGEIIISLTNFKVEPFFNKRPNLPFDDEIICPNDLEPQPSNKELIWILYMIATFFFFIALTSTCFLCCKHKEKKKSNDSSGVVFAGDEREIEENGRMIERV